jgi:hypothetical protein
MDLIYSLGNDILAWGSTDDKTGLKKKLESVQKKTEPNHTNMKHYSAYA